MIKLAILIPVAALLISPPAMSGEGPSSVPQKPTTATKTVDAASLGKVTLVNKGPGEVRLAIEGLVGLQMLGEMKKALAGMKPGTQLIEMDLNSPGGDVMAGLEIVELLRLQKKAGRKLVSIVRNGVACQSMCVPIYVQGDVRKAGPAASFMFHSVHLRILGIVGINLSKMNEKFMAEIFREAGVSQTWMNDLDKQEVFSSPRPYWASGRDLVEEGSNIVTELLPRHDPVSSIQFGKTKLWFN